MSKSSTVRSSQTSQICSADRQFNCITFKIVGILILNANTENIKQLSSGPEKLPSYQALGSLGPLGVKGYRTGTRQAFFNVSRMLCFCNFVVAIGYTIIETDD